MATISTNTYLDGGVARTAGEAWTINSGAIFTIRTDSRVHANAPASNTGSLGSNTVNDGEIVWEGRNVRWMPYNSGSGNVPAIGTTISQGGVSGYLLGVYASITSQATAPASAMPTSGFIKFREVTNGNFAAGALSGIGANATGPDVLGWISIVQDVSSNLTFPRLGKHTARGGRFYLDNTTGVRGQQFQIPTEGSTAMFAPGLFIETGVGTDEYDFWPALNGATNGWASMHLGNAVGTTDIRQKFLKAEAGGIMRMGETVTSASLAYASLAAQAGTYAQVSQSCTYTWANDVVEVYFASGHQLETGQQTGLDFTSGGATADGIYEVTVLDAYRFTVPLAGSGAAGNVTSRPGVTITFTAHTMNIGEYVYCDFTSGTATDRFADVYMVGSANAYTIKYPSATAITGGNVSCLHSLVITWTAHGFAQGQTFYFDFTSGTGVDGVYVAKVVATNTITINMAHSAATSGNCTLARDVGYVCGAGRKTWIPNIILNECATGARATNTAPNATIASRPKWSTTSAGAIDLEYVYGCSGYLNLAQPYSVRIRNCVFFDSIPISKVATALDIDGLYAGMHAALDAITLSLSNCYSGGTVKNVKAHRGNTPGSSDHAISITYCKGQTFENVEGGIIQYARSTGYCTITACTNLIFNTCRTINTSLWFINCSNGTVNNQDYNERFNGNGIAGFSAIAVSAGCHNLVIDGLTYGHSFQVPNQQPLYIANPIGCNNVKIRNCGTLASPLPMPTWAKNLSASTHLVLSGGSNNGVKIQKCFMEGVRTAPFVPVNSDKNMLYESCQAGLYVWSTKAILAIASADLNGEYKNIKMVDSTTGQASVYGTHFKDIFTGDYFGRFILACNEPTAETSSQFTTIVGTAKWNSSGGVIIQNVNDQHYWTDNVFRKGHTGFLKKEVVMTGGTLSNYNLHYQIDTGSGFSDWKNLYYQCAGASGTSGQYTFTVTDAAGVAVGDYCFGTGLSAVGLDTSNAIIPKVTQVNGNTITVDVANTGTVSGIIRFNHLPSETVDPAVGFKMKLRVTTVLSATAAITYIRMDTLTSPSAQSNYYPLDTAEFTFNVINKAGSPVTNYEYRIYLKDDTPGIIGTDIDGQELYTQSSYTMFHTYSDDTNIVVQILKDGYEESTTEYTINSTNQSATIILDPDYS